MDFNVFLHKKVGKCGGLWIIMSIFVAEKTIRHQDAIVWGHRGED